jgi:hypothetical protein
MMPDERQRPFSIDGESGVARRQRRRRLETVRADFFLDPVKRLSEQERALMTAMLHCLVVDIAEGIRAALPDRRVPSGDAADQVLLDRLTGAGLLDDPDLIGALLRRADEERIALAAASRVGRSGARLLQGLVGHDAVGVSAAAMALILARGRRRDRYGQCLLAFDDLYPETAALLVQRVAAVLHAETGIANRDLVEAAGRVVSGHRPEQSIAALSRALVEALSDNGLLGDDIILGAAHEGEIAFLAEALAHKANLPAAICSDELLAGMDQSIVALFRSAGLKRSVAAGLLASAGDLLGVVDPARAMANFAELTASDIEAYHRLLTSPAGYRSALTALGIERG